MVPRMTERDRQAADMQWIEWVASAVVGPTGLQRSPGRRPMPSVTRRSIPMGLCGTRLALVRVLGQSLDAIKHFSNWSGPKSTTAHSVTQERPGA